MADTRFFGKNNKETPMPTNEENQSIGAHSDKQNKLKKLFVDFYVFDVTFLTTCYPLSYTDLTKGLSFGALTVGAEWGCKYAIAPLANKIDYSSKHPYGHPTKLYLKPSFRRQVGFIAPLGEELLFRGILGPVIQYGLEKGMKLDKKHATIGSILCSSALFAACHPRGLRLSALVSGLVYGTVTNVCDGSLIPSTTAHLINNNVALSVISRTLK